MAEEHMNCCTLVCCTRTQYRYIDVSYTRLIVVSCRQLSTGGYQSPRQFSLYSRLRSNSGLSIFTRMHCKGSTHHIFLTVAVFDEHVRRGGRGSGGKAREMDFESFLDFVLALENRETPEGLTYLFKCLDLQNRGFLTTVDVHTLFRFVPTIQPTQRIDMSCKALHILVALAGMLLLSYAYGRKEEWQLSSDVGYSILSSYKTVATGNFLPAFTECRFASLIISRHFDGFMLFL